LLLHKALKINDISYNNALIFYPNPLKMKKSILFALFMCFFFSVYCQTQHKHIQTSYPGLRSPLTEITQQSILNGIRGMYATTERISVNKLPFLLDDSLSKQADEVDYALYKKYKDQIKNYFGQIISFGQCNNTIFSTGGFPFTFTVSKGSLVFMQNDVFFNYDLNTVKLDADERATYVIKNVILPSLKNFETLFTVKEIKFFAINVGYKARDFTDDIATRLDKGAGEQTSIIVSKDVIIKYINSEISDEQLMKLATFYNSNMNNTNVRLLTF